jgi:hypothetical protein
MALDPPTVQKNENEDENDNLERSEIGAQSPEPVYLVDIGVTKSAGMFEDGQ